MARVYLHDDLVLVGEAPTAVRVVLGDPGCGPSSSSEWCGDPLAPEVQVHPTLTVERRIRTSYDDDGVPQFEWETVTTGVAIEFTERTEIDDVAGVTRIVAKAIMLYDGEVAVTETAVVTSSHGEVVYEVTKVLSQAGILEMVLSRYEDSDDGG